MSRVLICVLIAFFFIFGCAAEDSKFDQKEDVKEDISVVFEDTPIKKAEPEPKPKPLEEVIVKPISINSEVPPELKYEIFYNNNSVEQIHNPEEIFPDNYSEMEGVLTFRGNSLRTAPAYGISRAESMTIEKLWGFKTSYSSWGGGGGWTGQPVIVKWTDMQKSYMNIFPEFKEDQEFIEVIYGSLDGRVYFLDLKSGKKSREPITVGNPIKGSVSIDSRGYPLLYVGEGVPENNTIGFNLYSLIDGERLHRINGLDKLAFRGWGAFDSSAIVNRNTDTMIVGGENGLFYMLSLNTYFEPHKPEISISPQTSFYRYRMPSHPRQGIENSVAIYKNLAFFADNSGYITSMDLTTFTPVWMVDGKDDTVATLTIDVIDDIPYIYSATQVDHQPIGGYSYIRKIHGLTGEVVWESKYPCLSTKGASPIDGGAFATNVVGKEQIDNMVIFTLARHGKMSAGLMVALDKNDGEEVWRWEMPNYSWSSPVDFYKQDGTAYLLQADSGGNLNLIDPIDGTRIFKINLGANMEASPAMFDDYIVVATRGGYIYGLKVE